MLTFPKYGSYKDSGVEWLGKIPSHWEVKRHLGLFDERKEVNQPDMELLSVTIDKGVVRQSEITTKKDSSNEDKSKYKVVRKDDLAYNKMRMWQGAIGRSDYDGIVSPAYIILNTRNRLYSQYFHYLYRTESFIREADRHSYGLCSDMNSLRYEDFKTIYSPVPPGEEVERIVEFLDRTTTEIDRAISQKQRLIELLQEQKAILINQAVTKGLNPNVPMRDSEIDAIGEIPKYWSIKKLGFLSNLLQTGPFGSQLHQEDYIEGGIPALNPSQLIDGEIRPDYKISVSEKMALRLERHRLIEGDIVFGRRGEMGRCGLVSVQEAGWLCGTGSILFRPKTNDISPRFALAVLRSHCMKSTLEYISVGATMDNLNTAILSKVSLPVPPLKEQRQIVMEIEKIKEEFSELISRQLKEIDLLNEMRQVMIASAVTGKIKV